MSGKNSYVDNVTFFCKEIIEKSGMFRNRSRFGINNLILKPINSRCISGQDAGVYSVFSKQYGKHVYILVQHNNLLFLNQYFEYFVDASYILLRFCI
jgi:hypothetical protein